MERLTSGVLDAMNHNRKRGATLVEALIGIAIVATVLLIIGGTAVRCVDSKDTATKQAREWATTLGLKNPRIDCATRDTDGDGYVSCNVAYDEGTSTKVVPVECAANFTINSGCRTPKPFIPRSN